MLWKSRTKTDTFQVKRLQRFLFSRVQSGLKQLWLGYAEVHFLRKTLRAVA